MYEAARDPIIADLAKALAARIDTLVTEMVRRITTEIEFYRNVGVKAADLYASLLHNTECVLAYLAGSGEEVDVAGAVRTGSIRARQGVPLPEILRSYRFGFTILWEQLLVEAVRSGPRAQAALLHGATLIWEISETHATAATAAYRDALAERLVETDRRRSALVATLVEGPPPGSDTTWEIARMLGFPYQGSFLLVVAEVIAGGEPPLPGLDVKCQAVDAGTAWRAQPGYELGVISCPRRQAVEQVLDAVRAVATGRVGVSPVYDRLDQSTRALRYARVALESLPSGTREVRQLDDTPLTELVMNNLETTQRAVHRILGGVLSLPEEDRTTLLATARAWLAAHGSAAEAGRALYCHQNTVRYRMHRLEEFLRGPLDDPKIVAELSMALDAVGTFPTLLERDAAPPEP